MRPQRSADIIAGIISATKVPPREIWSSPEVLSFVDSSVKGVRVTLNFKGCTFHSLSSENVMLERRSGHAAINF